MIKCHWSVRKTRPSWLLYRWCQHWTMWRRKQKQYYHLSVVVSFGVLPNVLRMPRMKYLELQAFFTVGVLLIVAAFMFCRRLADDFFCGNCFGLRSLLTSLRSSDPQSRIFGMHQSYSARLKHTMIAQPASLYAAYSFKSSSTFWPDLMPLLARWRWWPCIYSISNRLVHIYFVLYNISTIIEIM